MSIIGSSCLLLAPTWKMFSVKSAIWARLGRQCRLGRAMPILGAVSGNPFRPQTTVMRLHFYILFSISGSATARDSQPGAE